MGAYFIGDGVKQLETAVIEQAFKVSDSIFLVLLIGLALGTFWLIRWILRTNNEREARYITTIDKLAEVHDIKGEIADLKENVRASNERQEKMLGRVLDRLPPKGGE